MPTEVVHRYRNIMNLMWRFETFLVAAIQAFCIVQSQYAYPGQLNRIPGYHPAIAYPEFLDSRSGSHVPGGNYRQPDNTCPEVDDKCPRSCHKIDDRKCRICRCSSENESSTSQIGSVPTTRCFSMVMCMVNCKQGYRLSSTMDRQGCQKCTCKETDTEETNHNELEMMLQELKHQLASQSNSHPTTDTTPTDRDWDIDKMLSEMYGNGENHNEGGASMPMGVASETMTPVGGVSESGRGKSSNGCSGPMCPGNEGMNPMSPGGSSSKDSSCTGPFCLGQGGGMAGGGGAMGGITGSGGGAMGGMTVGGSGATGGGSSATSNGCSGPFCVSGGMMGGASGGMGGSGAGMGGGMGGFSPFGLAATSSGSSSGCSGPFCTMAGPGNGPGSM